MDRPLVTIMIPTRNNASTIARCLASVLEQDYDNLLVSALDNQSTDDTYDVLVDFERRYRRRMITGRTYGAVSQNELRARCQGMSSPRGRFVQFIDPNDVLLPSYVSRSVDLLASSPKVGCVLAHADVVLPSGDLQVTRPFRPTDEIISGERMMATLMADGFGMNVVQMYRSEVFHLYWAEGRVFNRLPVYLPLVMASTISDFAYFRDGLARRGDEETIAGDRFVPSLEQMFEHYLFLNAFNGIAARYKRNEVCALFPKAVQRLGHSCVRAGGVALDAGDIAAARGLLSQALAFAPEIAESDEFKRQAAAFPASMPNWP